MKLPLLENVAGLDAAVIELRDRHPGKKVREFLEEATKNELEAICATLLFHSARVIGSSEYILSLGDPYYCKVKKPRRSPKPKCRVCGTTEGLTSYPQGPCCNGPECIAF